MRLLIARLLCDDDGQDVVEYALVTATIGIAGIATWPLIQTSIGVAYGNYDIAIMGGVGNDQVTFQVNNNGGTPTFGPTGKAVLDGGLGLDLLTNDSKPVSKATGFETVI